MGYFFGKQFFPGVDVVSIADVAVPLELLIYAGVGSLAGAVMNR